MKYFCFLYSALFFIFLSPTVNSSDFSVQSSIVLDKKQPHGSQWRIRKLLDVSGGKDKKSIQPKKKGNVADRKKRRSPLKSVTDTLKQVYPATRAYLLLCLFCTVVDLVGAPAQALFSLDSTKLYEIWRYFTSIAYLGKPSMSMANSLYFLVRYGQTLESLNGTGDHAWFILVQTIVLSVLGLLLKFPFQAQAMISSTVYVSSHLNPLERVPFQFGFVIVSWQLPFCMMLIDVLSQQSIQAAWPHILGIFSGHVYHFFTKLWPALGGKSWLAPPKWFIKVIGEKKSVIPTANVRDKSKSTKNRSIPKNAKGVKLGDDLKSNS